MSQIAFVFPGQGSQAVGMGKELCDAYPEAKAVFDAADDALGEKLSRLCFEGPPSDLNMTVHTQPAVLAVSMAAHAVFSRRAPAPALVAGHSLGEYSALTAAGALRLPDAIRVVRQRGRWMQEAVPEGLGAMAVVIGLSAQKIAAVCAEAAEGDVLAPANYNSPEQTVVAGHARAVDRAAPKFKEAGAKRVLPLPVSAPFHCPLMEPVKPRLWEALRSISWKEPSCPTVSNVDARPNADVARIAPLLVDQVTSPVRWVECVQDLQRHGVQTIVELGPGRVLTGLIKRISPDLTSVNVEDSRSLAQALEKVAR